MIIKNEKRLRKIEAEKIALKDITRPSKIDIKLGFS
jgi:hypothetical protein